MSNQATNRKNVMKTGKKSQSESTASDEDRSTGGEASEESLSIEVVERSVDGRGERLFKQPIFLRYLEPYVDPPTTIELPPPPEPNPILLIQKDEADQVEKPIIYRELPTEPEHVVHLVKPPTPPRPIIIENIQRSIPRPPPILIERWLPPRYSSAPGPVIIKKKQKRRVIVVERKKPKVKIVKEFYNLGTRKVNSKEYATMLKKMGEVAVINGETIFIESRLSWDEFQRETEDARLSSGFSGDVKRSEVMTILGDGQLRI